MKKDRIWEFILEFKKINDYRPPQSDIARGVGITRQAVKNYFNRNPEKLKRFAEYRRYYD